MVPGAEKSGLSRSSSVGPRDENAAIPSGLSANLSVEIGESYFVLPHVHVMFARAFSVAPTVRTFFAVAGEPMESKSISPSRGVVSTPSLAAAKRITNSSCVRALLSACIDEVVYCPATPEPQELVWTRLPLAQASLNKSSRSLGIPSNSSAPLRVVAMEWKRRWASGAAPMMSPLL